jgi:GDPmannose 4,6-dehydratase
MWMMLQQDQPEDYVLATGHSHSIKEFLDEAFSCIGVDNWTKFVKFDSRFLRPVDPMYLLGDATKAKEKLGWAPKTSFKEMVSKMVSTDIVLHSNNI